MEVLQEQAVFPFVVEKVAPERLQFWARYAAQALTQDQMDVVGDVYHAFWHEAQAFYCYGRALVVLRPQSIEYVPVWLDLVLDSVLELVSERAWLRASRRLERLQGDPWPGDQWYQEACARSQQFERLAPEIAVYIAMLCEQYQLALPKYTQAFFDAQVAVEE